MWGQTASKAEVLLVVEEVGGSEAFERNSQSEAEHTESDADVFLVIGLDENIGVVGG